MNHLFAAAAAPTSDDVGIFVVCASVLLGFIAALISIAGYFATRREVDDLKARVDKIEQDLDDKTSRIHRRVNRLLAGQMLIAGRIGCALDQNQDQLGELMRQLENEED